MVQGLPATASLLSGPPITRTAFGLFSSRFVTAFEMSFSLRESCCSSSASEAAAGPVFVK